MITDRLSEHRHPDTASTRAVAWLRQAGTSLLALSALLLFACSDSNDSGNGDAGTTGSPFASASIADEHYASVTARIASPDIDDVAYEDVVQSLNGFALTAHRAQVATAPGDNAVIGHYSLATAMSLLQAAATGSTDTSIAQLLQVDGVEEATLHAAMNRLSAELTSRGNEGLTLRVANRLLARQGVTFGDAFMDIATGHYDAPATTLDVAGHNAEALALVNDWVSGVTDGLIPTLLDSLSPDTLVVLLNAVLLDATWQESMQDRGTLSFTALDGSVQSVASFGYTGSAQWFHDDAGLTVLELPYAGGDIAMLLMQPGDLAAFESSLDAGSIAALRNDLVRVQADVTLPQWRTETTLEPATLLAPYGFPQNPVELNDLLAAPVAGVDIQAVHKAVIEVDKDGTRAAAATGIGVVTSVPLVEETIVIDQPFAYVLIDRPTGAILFSGRVTDPTRSAPSR